MQQRDLDSNNISMKAKPLFDLVELEICISCSAHGDKVIMQVHGEALDLSLWYAAIPWMHADIVK